MARVKLTLGKKNPKEIDIPDIHEMITHPQGESLFVLGSIKYSGTTYREVFGIGTIWKICHGERFDCVYMKFGNPKGLRKIIVSDNHSRRQVMTLKRGHVTSFYGYARVVRQKRKDNGEMFTKWVLLARGFQDWYVPRAIEIKKEWKDNNDIESISENDSEWITNFLDQFEKTGED